MDQVDKVSAALDDDGMEEDNSQDEDYSDEESDDEIWDMEPPDDGPDDSMTLIQYQTKAHKEALVRKGSNLSDLSPKKGRMESEELRSWLRPAALPFQGVFCFVLFFLCFYDYN